MTAMSDLSTRRLKRAYLRAVKRVWAAERNVAKGAEFPHSAQTDLRREQSAVEGLSPELRRRGWSA